MITPSGSVTSSLVETVAQTGRARVTVDISNCQCCRSAEVTVAVWRQPGPGCQVTSHWRSLWHATVGAASASAAGRGGWPGLRPSGSAWQAGLGTLRVPWSHGGSACGLGAELESATSTPAEAAPPDVLYIYDSATVPQ